MLLVYMLLYMLLVLLTLVRRAKKQLKHSEHHTMHTHWVMFPGCQRLSFLPYWMGTESSDLSTASWPNQASEASPVGEQKESLSFFIR